MKRNRLLSLLFLIFQAQSITYYNIPGTDVPPGKRQYLMIDYYEYKNSLIVFGGNKDATESYNDVWEFSLDTKT